MGTRRSAHLGCNVACDRADRRAPLRRVSRHGHDFQKFTLLAEEIAHSVRAHNATLTEKLSASHQTADHALRSAVFGGIGCVSAPPTIAHDLTPLSLLDPFHEIELREIEAVPVDISSSVRRHQDRIDIEQAGAVGRRERFPESRCPVVMSTRNTFAGNLSGDRT